MKKKLKEEKEDNFLFLLKKHKILKKSCIYIMEGKCLPFLLKKVIMICKGGIRNVINHKLSRYACYLIV